MFMKAMQCEPEVVSKAMMNLSLIYVTRGDSLAQGGDLEGALKVALDAARYMDQGKKLLDVLASSGKADSMVDRFIQQYRPLRLQAHRLLGQLHAGAGDMASCEAEFRKATENFPDDVSAWKLLERVLQMQGKADDLAAVAERIRSLGF
jgi:tetratricopeptide (TPR) repeat protein